MRHRSDDVYMVVDAIGGTSAQAHEAAPHCVEQAGAKPISWAQLGCELQRDCRRADTAAVFSDILFATEGR